MSTTAVFCRTVYAVMLTGRLYLYLACTRYWCIKEINICSETKSLTMLLILTTEIVGIICLYDLLLFSWKKGVGDIVSFFCVYSKQPIGIWSRKDETSIDFPWLGSLIFHDWGQWFAFPAVLWHCWVTERHSACAAYPQTMGVARKSERRR